MLNLFSLSSALPAAAASAEKMRQQRHARAAIWKVDLLCIRFFRYREEEKRAEELNCLAEQGSLRSSFGGSVASEGGKRSTKVETRSGFRPERGRELAAAGKDNTGSFRSLKGSFPSVF